VRLLLLLVVGACVAAEPVQPIVAQSGPCRTLSGADIPSRDGLETHGSVAGRHIWATPRQLACSEAALGAADCFARPGRALVRIEGGARTVGYELRFQEALRISADEVTCVPPTDGP
jgi:hypothetical protein